MGIMIPLRRSTEGTAEHLAQSSYLTDDRSGLLPRGSALSRIHPVPASCPFPVTAPPTSPEPLAVVPCPTGTCHSPLVPLPGTQGPLKAPEQPQYTASQKDGAQALKGSPAPGSEGGAGGGAGGALKGTGCLRAAVLGGGPSLQVEGSCSQRKVVHRVAKSQTRLK